MEPDEDDHGEDLLAAARIPARVIAAAAAQALAAAMSILVGLQNLWLVHWVRPALFVYAPYVLLGLGAAGLFIAGKLHRARTWSLPIALPLALLLTVGNGGWFWMTTVSSNVFAPLSLLTALAALVAVVLDAIALPPFRALAAVRRRLYRAGIDLNL
jgi:hypothetical protein